MKRLITASIGAAAMAAPLASSPALGATEVNWWHAMGGRLGEKVKAISEGFNKSQTQCVVKPTYKGNYTETMTSAVAAFRARKHPHIVQVFEVGTASMMAAKGAVYPTWELMKDTGEAFDQSKYLPAVISYYSTTDGKLLSLPFNSSTPVLWYNKDMFKKAGLDPNKPPKTWTEVADYSKKLLKSGAKCGFSFGWQSWVMIENFSAWHNLAIGTRENGFAGTDTKLTFNNPQVVGMISKIADWQKKGIFQYGGRRGDSLPKFVKGECAMWINSSAYYAGIKKQAKFAFGQAMLPVDSAIAEKPQNSIIGGATLWVLRGHKKAEYTCTAKFFTYMSTPAVQADWHQFTGYVPITTAAYELSRKQGYYKKNPGTDIAIKQLSLNTPTPNSRGLRFGNFVQIRDIINEELEAVWAGKKTAKDGLNAAVERSNKLLRKFEAAN